LTHRQFLTECAREAEIWLPPLSGGRFLTPPSIPEKALKAGGRQLGIADSVLDRLVPKVGLDGPGIDAFVCQLKSAGVPQHVRVDLHFEAGSLSGAF
jgi:hypothetical protein